MDKKTALEKAKELNMDPVDFLLLAMEIRKYTKSRLKIEKDAAFVAERSRKLGYHIPESDPFEALYVLYQRSVALSCMLEPDVWKRMKAEFKVGSLVAS